ncbi:MAG: adenylate/guanylate cyclase domain-containing protein, partial [Bacteroidota bacterium]
APFPLDKALRYFEESLSAINTCFEAFDRIMDKYSIERIKTIGDAYMAAGGLPISSRSSVQHTVNIASRMESSSEIGKGNISQAIYELLQENPQFLFGKRGKVTLKGKRTEEAGESTFISGVPTLPPFLQLYFYIP